VQRLVDRFWNNCWSHRELFAVALHSVAKFPMLRVAMRCRGKLELNRRVMEFPCGKPSRGTRTLRFKALIGGLVYRLSG